MVQEVILLITKYLVITEYQVIIEYLEVDPVDIGVTAPPGELPFGIVAGVPLDEADCLFDRDVAVKIFKSIISVLESLRKCHKPFMLWNIAVNASKLESGKDPFIVC